MSEDQDQFKHLDIGGGPVPSILPKDLRKLIYDGESHQGFAPVHESRATKLAIENPDKKYFVIDPQLSKSRAKLIQTEVPNIQFVTGQSEKNHALPFADSTFDRVEMNFVFTPLTQEQRDNAVNEAPPNASLEDQLQLLDQWESQEISPQDVPLFTSTLTEATRILKPGGTLAICEKRQRIQRIQNLLGNPDFRAKLSLEELSQKEINEPTTIYAKSAHDQKRIKKEQGKTDEANQRQVVLLELRKSTS